MSSDFISSSSGGMQEGSSGDQPSHNSIMDTIQDEHNYEENAIEAQWVAAAGSTSSLSGGFTTITNLVSGENSGGNQQGTPSRSIFQVIGAIEGGPSSLARSSLDDSFASYYNMQKNGTHIRQDAILKHQETETYDDIEQAVEIDQHAVDNLEEGGGGFCEHAECVNVDSDLSTEGRGSSLSSITNDFFPKFSMNGRFMAYGDKQRSMTTTQENTSPSPQSSSNENKTDSNPSSSSKKKKKRGTNMLFSSPSRRKRNNLGQGSPWYSISLQPQQKLNHNTIFSSSPPMMMKQIHQMPDLNRHELHLQQQQHHHLQDQFAIQPPKEVVITPHHCNNLDDMMGNNNNHSYYPPPSLSPSIISSNSISQLFTNELRERYRKSIYRSYGVRHYYTSTSKKKSVGICMLVSILIAVLAITAVVLVSSNKRNGDTASSPSTLDENAVIISLSPKDDELPSVCCVDEYEALDGNNTEEEADPKEEKEESDGDIVETVDDTHSGVVLTISTPSEDNGITSIATPIPGGSPWVPEEEPEEEEHNEPTIYDPQPDKEILFSVSQVDEPTNPADSSSVTSPSPPPTTKSPINWGTLALLIPTSLAPTSPPTPIPTTRHPTLRPSNTPSRRPITPGPSRFPTRRPVTTPYPTTGGDLRINGDCAGGCDECEGDCDNDDQCKGDLYCFKRDDFEDVPGCLGRGVRGKDYCAEGTPKPSKKPTRKPTKKPSTPKPTKTPTLRPTNTPDPTTDTPISSAPSSSPVTQTPSSKPLTQAPTRRPLTVTNRPTDAPQVSTTTSTATSTITTTSTSTTTTTPAPSPTPTSKPSNKPTTRTFDKCPPEYSSSAKYVKRDQVSYSRSGGSNRNVYECFNGCNISPSELSNNQWTLLGLCIAEPAPRNPPTTLPPSPYPTVRVTPMPTPLPTAFQATTSTTTSTITTTSTSITPMPTPPPTALPTKNPTPEPTPEPLTPEPSPDPTPKPSPLV